MKEEAKIAKREYDRKRREEMKKDPVKLQQMREKERKKYLRKREKGVTAAKLVSQMSNRELRNIRKGWKKRSLKYRENKKRKAQSLRQLMLDNSPPSTPPPGTSNETENDIQQPSTSRKAVGRRRVLKNRSAMARKVKKLEENLTKAEIKAERYKKKYQRLKKKKAYNTSNQAPLTPKSRVNKMLEKEKVSPEIRKRLLFCEVIASQLTRNYTSLGGGHKIKRAYYLTLRNNMLKKYRLMNYASRAGILKRKCRNNCKDLSSITVRPRGHYINDKIKEDVIKFFERDDISRSTAGKNDCVTVKKEKRQKRLLNDNLNKLHEKFLTTVGYKLSYQSFCRLKPFWIKYPQARDRETCSCIIHVNLEFLVKKLYDSKVFSYFSANDILRAICCRPYTAACLFRKCFECKDKTMKIHQFEDCEVKVRKWDTVATKYMINGKERIIRKVEKQEIIMTIVNLYKLLHESLNKFMCHVGNIVHQFNAMSKLKSTLKPNEVIIHVDFSENYDCKYAEEIQSFHFGGSRQQVTLHTGVMYLKLSAEDVTSFPFCTMSESLRHDAFAIWAHLKPIFQWAIQLQKNETLNIFHMLSDSPVTQYRNKTMFQIISNYLEKIIPTIEHFSWNYTETGHGKGAPDGVGGTLKRSADRAVAEGKDVPNFDALISVVKKRCPGVYILKVTNEDIQKCENEFSEFHPFPFIGTMKVHQVIYTKTIPHIFFNSLSCFECPFEKQPCSHFYLGSGYERFSK